MMGGDVASQASPYTSAGYGTSTQVQQTYGSADQQTGTAGMGGQIIPKSQNGGRKSRKARRMRGGNADVQASSYSAGALPAGCGNTSTQVMNVFGGIDQQTGSAGPSSGLIQPLASSAQSGGRRRRVKGGSGPAPVDSNQIITAAGNGTSAGAMPFYNNLSPTTIYPQTDATKPIV